MKTLIVLLLIVSFLLNPVRTTGIMAVEYVIDVFATAGLLYFKNPIILFILGGILVLPVTTSLVMIHSALSR